MRRREFITFVGGLGGITAFRRRTADSRSEARRAPGGKPGAIFKIIFGRSPQPWLYRWTKHSD
jgi:hypothetical protein